MVHIGGWLRNIFSFYQLELSRKYVMNMNSAPIPTTENLENIFKTEDLKKVDVVSVSRCFYRLKRSFSKKDKKTGKENEVSFKLPCLKEFTIRKVALKGKYMNNYYPSSKFLEKMKLAILNIENDIDLENFSNNMKFCSQDSTIKNNWNRHFYNYIENIFKDLEIIESLNNNYINMLQIIL